MINTLIITGLCVATHIAIINMVPTNAEPIQWKREVELLNHFILQSCLCSVIYILNSFAAVACEITVILFGTAQYQFCEPVRWLYYAQPLIGITPFIVFILISPRIRMLFYLAVYISQIVVFYYIRVLQLH